MIRAVFYTWLSVAIYIVLLAIWRAVRGCRHKRMSWPVTAVGSDGVRRTTVVCHRCGTEFEYDLETMHMGPELTVRVRDGW